MYSIWFRSSSICSRTCALHCFENSVSSEINFDSLKSFYNSSPRCIEVSEYRAILSELAFYSRAIFVYRFCVCWINTCSLLISFRIVSINEYNSAFSSYFSAIFYGYFSRSKERFHKWSTSYLFLFGEVFYCVKRIDLADFLLNLRIQIITHLRLLRYRAQRSEHFRFIPWRIATLIHYYTPIVLACIIVIKRISHGPLRLDWTLHGLLISLFFPTRKRKRLLNSSNPMIPFPPPAYTYQSSW